MRRTARGVWRPEDRAEDRYRYVPVDVPAGARVLRVELAYDRTAGVLDLGLFDPDGQFRGYSGGARGSVAVARDWATPGYLSGELPAGQWSVLLGLHRVPPGGLPWEVLTVTGRDPTPPPPTGIAPAQARSPGPRAPAGPPRRAYLPIVDGLHWFAGDLHAHSVHSDGTQSVDELAALAVAAGLDFLALTDHNTVSHHPYLAGAGRRYGLTLLPGQEVTADRGHANAFGDIGWVDFRRPAADWVSTVASRGGLLSVNHPLAADHAWRHPLPDRPRLAEVWHSGWWDRTWGAPLAWLLAWAPRTVPVGGSDYHSPAQSARLGHPTTWAQAASPSTEDILGALAAGRTAVSEAPDGPLLLRAGDELVALDADGLLLCDVDGRRRVLRGARASQPAAPGLHWLEDHQTRIMALCA